MTPLPGKKEEAVACTEARLIKIARVLRVVNIDACWLHLIHWGQLPGLADDGMVEGLWGEGILATEEVLRSTQSKEMTCSPPRVDRIRLCVYYNKIPIYPIVYLRGTLHGLTRTAWAPSALPASFFIFFLLYRGYGGIIGCIYIYIYTGYMGITENKLEILKRQARQPLKPCIALNSDSHAGSS